MLRMIFLKKITIKFLIGPDKEIGSQPLKYSISDSSRTITIFKTPLEQNVSKDLSFDMRKSGLVPQITV